MDTNEKLLFAIDEARVLGYFNSFCEKNESNQSRQRLRNILSRATDKENAIKSLLQNEQNIHLSDIEVKRMQMLIEAYLRKSKYRKSISKDTKLFLLNRQENKCCFCGAKIDMSAHADHIVPFKLVGDELENNLQMLCEHCNESKNASIDYEIRFLLHTL